MPAETSPATVAAPQVSVVIPVYNEAAGLPALFARLYPALDALRVRYEVIFVNDGSRDASAALLKDQYLAPSGRHARRPVQRQLRPAPGDHRRLRARARRARRDAGRGPAESAGGNRPAAGGHGRGPRLRRRRAAHARGCVVAAGRVARDERAAREDHPHPDDRPGLHAARATAATSPTPSRQAARSARTSRRWRTRLRTARPRSTSGTKSASPASPSIRCTS